MIRALFTVACAVMMLAIPNARAEGGEAPGLPAATSSTSGSEAIPEVTVTANRIELEKRVARYVNQIAAAENGDEGLARWQVPVCPLVSGLPRQDGEFILGRLSQIAHVAAVPLADEHCRPNLYILVTDQPEELLRGMEQRNRAYTFGYDASSGSYPPTETKAGVVDEFIKTPRAVRAWYNSAEKDAWGNPIRSCPYRPGEFAQCVATDGARAVLSTVWTIGRAFIIVDQKRLHQVKLGQLADYVAMTGFAKLKPDARLGNAPTILTLFTGAPEAAPTAMTDWDQTFLKYLYATDQISKHQRGQIARSMARDIAK